MGRTTTSKSKIKSHKAIETRTDFFFYAFRNILLVSLPLVLISALVLSLPHSSAYSSSTDNVSLTLPSACTISASVIEGHNATIVNGQYEGDVGNTKINAFCNDNNGYFIYAIGTSGDTDGNTDLISSANDSYNIHTNVYNASTLTPSTPSSWAMKLSSNNGAYAPTIIDGYDSYSTIPNTDTIVAYRASGTSMDVNTDLTGSYFNTTYEIYTNPVQPAGTYLGKVKYTMTHPYDSSQLPNMENAFDIVGKDKVTVTDPVTGITGSYYKMQDMSERICNLTKVYGELSATQLVDIRDNKVYWVAKLADNHCWMTQNLDLDIISDTNAQNYIALTSENTDLSTDESVYTDSNTIYALKGENDTYGYTYENGIATWTPERSTIVYDQLSSATWASDNNHPYSYDRLDNNGNPVYPDSNVSQAIAGNHGLSGNYYNWTASIASNDSTNANVNSSGSDQINSICPKGWRLPSAANKEFGDLLVTYNIIQTNTSTAYLEGGFNKMSVLPLYFVRGGYIFPNGSLGDTGGIGNYWTSTGTTYNGPGVFFLYFTSGSVQPQRSAFSIVYDGKRNGRPTRCLAR